MPLWVADSWALTCERTAMPSFDRWTSVSSAWAPASIAPLKATMVFSGQWTLEPRCATHWTGWEAIPSDVSGSCIASTTARGYLVLSLPNVVLGGLGRFKVIRTSHHIREWVLFSIHLPNGETRRSEANGIWRYAILYTNVQAQRWAAQRSGFYWVVALKLSNVCSRGRRWSMAFGASK